MIFRPIPSSSIEKIKEDTVNINLLLTRRCNFKCAHCMFAAGPHLPADYMSYDDLRLVRGFMDNLKEKHDISGFSINMVGGEPTLDLDKFNDICRHVENIFDDASIEMTTNGWWLREWSDVKRFAKATWRLIEKNDLSIRISDSQFHTPFRKWEKRILSTEKLKNAFESPLDYWDNENNVECNCCDGIYEQSNDDSDRYVCSKCQDDISFDEYYEKRDAAFYGDGDDFVQYLVKSLNNGTFYVDHQSPDKISPVGRAKKLDNAFQDGGCDATTDVKFTFQPGGALYDPCCNGGHVRLGHAQEPEQLFRARYWFMKALHKAYPKPNDYSYNALNGERCRNCPVFGAKWLSVKNHNSKKNDLPLAS